MRRISRRSGLCLASAALFAGVGVLAARVYKGRFPLSVDHRAARAVPAVLLRLHLIGTEGSRARMSLVLAVGLTVIAVVTLGLALAAWRRHDGWGLLLCLLGPGLAYVLTELVGKPLVGRHRGPTFSFPSGHATVTASVAAVFLLLVHRWYGWRSTIVLTPVACVVPLTVCVAVLQLGWHYPTDLVGGVGVGLASVLAVAAALPDQFGARRLDLVHDRLSARAKDPPDI